MLNKFLIGGSKARSKVGLRPFQVIDEAVRPKSMKPHKFNGLVEEARAATLMFAVSLARQNGYLLVPQDGNETRLHLVRAG